MTRTALKTVAIAIAVFAVGAQAHGAEPLARSRAAQLRAVRDRLSWEASTTKGARQQLLLMEERRLDRFISDLERGRSVDPAEIDRLLRRGVR